MAVEQSIYPKIHTSFDVVQNRSNEIDAEGVVKS